MSLETHYPIGTLLAVLWSGWLAYTLFKRAIYPPKDRFSFWGYNEVEKVNRHPLVRTLMVLCGLLVLFFAIALAVSK